MDKIKRYVDNFLKTHKISEKYEIHVSEMDACINAMSVGPFRTICTLFDYGYAKSYRAAVAEMEKEGGTAV